MTRARPPGCATSISLTFPMMVGTAAPSIQGKVSLPLQAGFVER